MNWRMLCLFSLQRFLMPLISCLYFSSRIYSSPLSVNLSQPLSSTQAGGSFTGLSSCRTLLAILLKRLRCSLSTLEGCFTLADMALEQRSFANGEGLWDFFDSSLMPLIRRDGLLRLWASGSVMVLQPASNSDFCSDILLRCWFSFCFLSYTVTTFWPGQQSLLAYLLLNLDPFVFRIESLGAFLNSPTGSLISLPLLTLLLLPKMLTTLLKLFWPLLMVDRLETIVDLLAPGRA